MKRTFGLIFWFVLLFMALVSCIGDGGEQLEGTSWKLVSMGSRPVLPGGAPTLFFEDGSVGGNAGCNSFGGEYTLRGGQFKFGNLFSTLMACVDNERMDQETTYMKLLGQVDRFELRGGQLILTTTHGEQLVFVSGE